MTVHVLDASRSVSVASSLLSKDDDTRNNYILNIKEEYERVRKLRGNRKSSKKYLTIKKARENKLQLDWENYDPPKPTFLGTRVFDDYSLEELAEYIDWTPFFSTWELRGKYPAIFEDSFVGEEAKTLFNDAQSMLRRIIDEKWLTAKLSLIHI